MLESNSVQRDRRHPVQGGGFSNPSGTNLVYQEEGKIVAHALEMDLVGHGDTIDEAIADLRDLIRMQVEFAISRNNPDLMFPHIRGE